MSISDEQESIDRRYMASALALAEKGLYTTAPNPRVGCIIVSNGSVVGEGWHVQAGGDHAEVSALKQAKGRAENATVYVTLEPCCVTGRTGPCTQALIEAGVARVVYAMCDPNPEVDGRGREALEAAGISVSGGVLAAEAERLNKGFCKRMQSDLPWVMVKTASSLDGRTAMASGESQWVTGEESRLKVQQLRAESCAIVTGVETIVQDNPSFVVRERIADSTVLRQPALIIADSTLRLSTEAKVFSDSVTYDRQLIVACLSTAAESKKQYLRGAGAEVWELPVDGEGRVDLSALLAKAGELEYNELMIEAGATLLGQCLLKGLVDELVSFVAPKLLGSTAKPLANVQFEQLDQAVDFRLEKVEQVGNDVMLRGVKRAGE